MQTAGAAAVVAAGHRLIPAWFNAQAEALPHKPASFLGGPEFPSVGVSHADELTLPAGFRHEVLLKCGDMLNAVGDRYGDHNDYLTYLLRDDSTGWLWCNHENANTSLITGDWSKEWTRERAALHLQNQGGSAVRIERRADGSWRPVLPHPDNFRVDGLSSRIALSGPASGTSWVQGAKTVIGSAGNCGGGLTPWGTICTAEENYQDIWGDPDFKVKPSEVVKFFPRPTEHYGYIVEVDPAKRAFIKHTALGRFAHENIAFSRTSDGRLVGYMGDDRNGQCLYKFISRDRFRTDAGEGNRRLLERGTLYVADTERGRWLPLDPARNRRLRNAGFDLAKVCVFTRQAAALVGGTPLARPEDVEVHPVTGDVFVALTSWTPGKVDVSRPAYFKDMAGAVARLREARGDAGAMEFSFEIFVPGSRDTGLVWPDNLAFTDDQQLMVTTDFSVKNKPVEASTQSLFGNNFLMLVPTQGADAGKVKRLAVSPRCAEFCSPTLSPDRRELWVNVQHPGDDSTKELISSHWPDGGESMPRSAMVAIRRNG